MVIGSKTYPIHIQSTNGFKIIFSFCFLFQPFFKYIFNNMTGTNYLIHFFYKLCQIQIQRYRSFFQFFRQFCFFFESIHLQFTSRYQNHTLLKPMIITINNLMGLISVLLFWVIRYRINSFYIVFSIIELKK